MNSLSDIYRKQLMVGQIHKESRQYKRKQDFAINGIKKMLELGRRNYVSVSFGKQSICLAHMVYQVSPDIAMFFLSSGESWCIHNFAEVIDVFMSRFPINLTIVQTNHCGIGIDDMIEGLSRRQPSIKWIFKGDKDRNLTWKQSRDMGDKDLEEMCDRDEWDGWFWGLAIEESKARKITLTKKWEGQPHPSIFRYSDGKYRCCPLMTWKWQDIAAYVTENNLKLLYQYEVLGLQTRTTARATKMMVEQGGMNLVRYYNKDGYRRLVERFPEIRA